MKKILYFFIVSISVTTACKKQSNSPVINVASVPPYLAHVQEWLKIHMPLPDYNSINFTQVHISKDATKWYLRFHIKNKITRL